VSRFDTQYAAGGRPGLFHHLGQTITYSAPDQDDVTLTALVGTVEQRLQADDAGERLVSGRSVTITTDPTAAQDGVADPRRTAVVTIDGTRWSVVSVTTLSANLARLDLTLLERFEQARRGYRPTGR